VEELMRVLVTGAGGFAGKHVISHLIEHTDWKIVALDRGSEGLYLEGERIRAVTYDLCGPMNPHSSALNDVDAVVNLAASSDMESFLRDPTTHTMNNVLSTLHLLEWARYRKLHAFIQVSTNEVYGPAPTYDSREWDPLLPSTPYSASKAAQEVLGIGWWKTYDIPLVIVNTMHLFGEGQPRERFVPTAIAAILNGERVPIYGRRQGTTWRASRRNWTYVGDFALAIHMLLTKTVTPSTGMRPDRWNVAGTEWGCYHIAEWIAQLLKMPLEVDWLSDRVSRPGYEHRYALDIGAFRNFGYQPRFGVEVGLKRTIDWMKRELGK
jgi:dTDP-glucose 4,6-dehydratase